jgi:hypothetical protein
VLSFARSAEAKCKDLAIARTVNVGWVIPSNDCPASLYGEFVFAIAGFNDDRREDQVSLRFMAENGVLFELPHAPDWELGPVVAFSVAGDTAGPGVQYGVSPMLHSRVWFASDWLTLDMAGGPSAVKLPDGAWRPGVYTRLGPTIHGAFGIHVSYDHVFGTEDHRFLFGVDMTYAVAGLLACAAAAGAGGGKCF